MKTPGVTTKTSAAARSAADVWTRSVQIWIISGQMEILCKQYPANHPEHAGKWQSFIEGSPDTEQSSEDFAMQQLSLQIGLKQNIRDLDCLYTRNDPSSGKSIKVYLISWDGEISSLHPDLQIVKNLRWIPLLSLDEEMKLGNFCNRLDMRILEAAQNLGFHYKKSKQTEVRI